ncbi:hypothetical protein D8676_04975 [Mesorhizobium sp. YM1C-6-2]|nr:hypothetical protein D8676_04975 [Mesorhizobium sp. YM1C-6-2]
MLREWTNPTVDPPKPVGRFPTNAQRGGSGPSDEELKKRADERREKREAEQRAQALQDKAAAARKQAQSERRRKMLQDQAEAARNQHSR